MSEDLIVTARKLARASPKKPRQADLKRAVSTAYYALFHALAKNAADQLVGVGQNRPDKAWAQVYRSLQHGEAKNARSQVRNLRFPATIVSCADAFVKLQEDRHSADYDSDHRVTRADALDAIALAEQAIKDLKATPGKDRRAFAVHLVFKKRSNSPHSSPPFMRSEASRTKARRGPARACRIARLTTGGYG